MSSEGVRLGPVSYVVLGIAALRGSTTPYDLKRFIQLSIGHFWPFPHTQLYAEPERLAQAGLLEETREETGRRRRHYTITAAGHEELERWLVEPVTGPTEFRDLGLLKLFFSELADDDDMVTLATEQAAAHRAKIAVYDAIRERYTGRTDLAHRLLALEMGTRLAEAAATFWDEVQSAASASASTASGDWAASITAMRSGSAAASVS
jgi:PadR family transcriptional regulator AphA